MARRDEGAYCWYVTEEQRSQPGCIGREGDRLRHSRALSRRFRTRCDLAPNASIVYLCGNPGMIAAASRVLSDLGLADDAIRSEHYWPA